MQNGFADELPDYIPDFIPTFIPSFIKDDLEMESTKLSESDKDKSIGKKSLASKRLRIWRGLLTLILTFHLVCVILVPNQGTYLAYRISSFAEPYMNFFELASRWSFFAPDPGPPPFHIEYEILDQDGNDLFKGEFPKRKDPFFLRERQNRRIAAAKFMISTDQQTQEGMAPYLCRSHPEAHSVRLWRVQHSIPGLMEVVKGEAQPGLKEDVMRRWVSHTYCEELN